MRPPTRVSASRSRTSRPRSSQALASPAIPPPTTTASTRLAVTRSSPHPFLRALCRLWLLPPSIAELGLLFAMRCRAPRRRKHRRGLPKVAGETALLDPWADIGAPAGDSEDEDLIAQDLNRAQDSDQPSRIAALGHHLRCVVPDRPGMELAALVASGSVPAAPVDRPRLGAGRNLALLGTEGGQDLCLLALGHLEVVHGVDKLLSDFVEHLG